MVSVIVPSHNSASYILETIESILNQDYQDFEIIVADDCSNDNTVQVAQSLNSDKIRSIVLQECHGGPSLPRNVGIKGSRGEYIAFCDSDDLLSVNMLKESIKCLESYQNIGMCLTNAIKFDEKDGMEKNSFLIRYSHFGSILKNKVENNVFLIAKEDAYKGLFYENYILTPGCVVVPRHVFDKVGHFDESLKNADDWDMWLRITEKFDIGYIDIIGLKSRKRPNSITARGSGLIANRLMVLLKHLNKNLPYETYRQIRRLILENYFSAAYAFQRAGDMVLARKYYLKSMKNIKCTISSVKGVAVTLFGA
jgi:glycosyltransferase involved in cell wall biosynthesis